MDAKFLIAIAGIIAVMAALVAMPRFANQPPESQQELAIDYSRKNLTALEDGRLVAGDADDLKIGNDRSAVYRNLTGAAREKTFAISNEETNRLKDLIISTGFLDAAKNTDYPQKDGIGNLTKYSLRLTSGGDSKLISWVNPEASEGTVPAIVRNIGAQLDAIIERHI